MPNRRWMPLIALSMAVIATPSMTEANLVCPDCEAMTLGVTEVVDLVLGTLLSQGISILLVGAAAIVGLPWFIAGVAVALMYLPRWLKTS